MIKTYFFWGAGVLLSLTACHSHHHGEEVHAHETEVTTQEDGHHHHVDEIVLSAEKAKAAGLVVETVNPRRFQQVIRSGGHLLNAQGQETTVVAATSGVVRFTRSIVSGMSVSQGDLLFTLSSDRIQDGDPVERARIVYERAKAEYDRAVPLAAKQIVTQRELENLKADYEEARLSYEALASGHTEKGTAVRASMNGFIKNVEVGEGDYVTAGQPLLTITQNRRLQLRADVSERYYRALKHIRSARFKTPYDDRLHSIEDMNGRLLSYGRASETDTYYIPVTFEFDNVGDLIPGAFVETYLLGEERTDVLTLPLSALTEEQGVYFVYLQIDETCYVKREVKTGADDGLRIEIFSGVKSGDRVVVEGAYHVRLASTANTIPAHSHSH